MEKKRSGQKRTAGRARASSQSPAKSSGQKRASGQLYRNGAKKSKRVKKKHPLRRAIFQAAFLILIVAGVMWWKGSGRDQWLGKEKQSLRMSGIEKMDLGDYAGAIADFDAAIEASRGKAGAFEIDVLNYRAEAEYMLKDYQAAVHTYDMLRQIDKERITYWYRLAAVKAMAGDLDGGLEAYGNGVSLEKKETEGERQSENMAVSGSSERAKALEAVGQACFGAGRQEEANELYGDAIRDGEADAFVFNAMGLTYLETGRYQEALGCFEQAILEGAEESASAGTVSETGAAVKKASFNRAVAYEYMRQYQKAIQCFEDYITEFGPDEAAQKEILFLQTR